MSIIDIAVIRKDTNYKESKINYLKIVLATSTALLLVLLILKAPLLFLLLPIGLIIYCIYYTWKIYRLVKRWDFTKDIFTMKTLKK